MDFKINNKLINNHTYNNSLSTSEDVSAEEFFGGNESAEFSLNDILKEYETLNSKINEENSNQSRTEEYIQNIIPNFKDDGTIRSNLLKTDIDLLHEADKTGKNINDLIVPHFKEIEEGHINSKIGDVFEVNGFEKIFLKTKNDESIKLDISKETYNKLFPPIKRFVAKQGDINDCFIVSSINNMMTNPELRQNVLSCFREDKNGNITIDIPNCKYTFTLKNGTDLSDYTDTSTLADASLGFQLLEYTYGINLKEEYIQEELNKLDTNEIDTIENFEKHLKETISSASIRNLGGTPENTFEDFNIDCYTIPINSDYSYYSINDLFADEDIIILSAGTNSSPNNETNFLNKEKGILGSHVYSLYPIKNQNEEWYFEAIDPYNETNTIKISTEEAEQYFKQIFFTIKNDS